MGSRRGIEIVRRMRRGTQCRCCWKLSSEERTVYFVAGVEGSTFNPAIKWERFGWELCGECIPPTLARHFARLRARAAARRSG